MDMFEDPLETSATGYTGALVGVMRPVRGPVTDHGHLHLDATWKKAKLHIPDHTTVNVGP